MLRHTLLSGIVSRLATIWSTNQGWRFARPPPGLPADLRESAVDLLAGLLRGFCTLNGLPRDKFVPLSAAPAPSAAGLRLFSPVCGCGVLLGICPDPGAACDTLDFFGFLGFLMI
jgi:hypothetical protein